MKAGLQLKRLMDRTIVEARSLSPREKPITSALLLCTWRARRSFLDNSKQNNSSFSSVSCSEKKEHFNFKHGHLHPDFVPVTNIRTEKSIV